MNLGTDGYSSPSAANLSYPYQLATDGTKLFVADTGLNRVLIWNSVPAANGVGANTVIGQPDMATKDYRTASAQDFATPTSVAFGNGKLYVTDGDNSRILVWNSVPTGNYVAADGVHGQPVFSTIAPNSGGGVSKDSLATGPVGLFADSLRVFVGDPYNRRIKIIEHF
jgi:hypothetical protein